MSILELRKFFVATLMAFAMAIVLPACSSSDEAAEDSSSSDSGGVPCELDIMQPGCSKEDVDM